MEHRLIYDLWKRIKFILEKCQEEKHTQDLKSYRVSN